MRSEINIMAVICLFGTIFGMTAEARVYDVCIGEYENHCPKHQIFYGCKDDGSAPAIDEVIKQICTIQTERGPLPFRSSISQLKVYGGNKCNYSSLRVECTQPNQEF